MQFRRYDRGQTRKHRQTDTIITILRSPIGAVIKMYGICRSHRVRQSTLHARLCHTRSTVSFLRMQCPAAKLLVYFCPKYFVRFWGPYNNSRLKLISSSATTQVCDGLSSAASDSFNHAFHSFFYRAMLCIRGTSHGPVSVCLSVRHKSEFY